MSQSSRKFPQSTFLVQQPDGQLTSEQALSVLNAGLLEVLDSPDGTVASVTKPAGDIVGTSATQTLTNKTIDFDANSITLGHDDLTSGKGNTSHADIDSHIGASGSNVHGLGTISTQDSDAVSITGGSVTGITDVTVADGGTGASTASAARTNLGLVIGTDVQAQNDILADLAGLTQAAAKGIYFNGATTAATFDLTAAGLALLDDANVAAQHVTLGLGDSATKDTGTASGTVATGDHLHDSEYINKTNSVSFTPSADHHPATKKYVDDNDEGEANTASNVGTAGVGIFKQKATLDFQFKKLNAGSTKVTITDDTSNNEVDIDVDQTVIDHDLLLNFAAGEHRVINDSLGDGATTTLWSADKIFDELAGKSATHSHPYLATANNLSEITGDDKATARTNLGLGTAAVKDFGDAVFNADAIRSKTIKNETPSVNGQLLTFTNDVAHADDQKWKAWTYGLPQGTSTAGYVLKIPVTGTTLEWAADTGYTHPNHSGDITSVNDGDTTIGANKVTLAKMAQMATDSLLGRTTDNAGNVEVLSAGDVRTILNVADGATADQDLSSYAPKANPTFTGTVAIPNVTDLETAVVANNAKATNVTTNLSIGTTTATTVDINSSDGNNATIPEATTSAAGLLSADKWDEIVANTSKATNVSTALSVGTNNTTVLSITSDGGADDVTLPIASTSVTGVMSSALWDKLEGIEANATTDQDLSTYALLSDPDLTGTPTAPTATAGTNTTQLATTAFVKAEFGNVDALIYKGVQDCSANPDYPAADAGHVYKCSVAGKIGGASGVDVTVGDLIICDTDSTSTGNDATVGSKWSVVQGDLSIIDNLTSTSTINALSANQGKVLKTLADTKLTGTGSFAITASSVTDGTTTFNKYTHPTSTGNKHVPTGGSSGNFLKYSSSGTAVWAADNNTEYSVFTGASSGGNGTTGLAPQPDAGEEEYFLRGDSTWQEVAGTITALNNQTVNRLVSIGATTTELDGEANLTFDAATNILGVGGIVHVSSELGSTPTAPANGAGGYIYTKADGKPYWITNGESEVDLSASATGAGHTIQDEGDDLDGEDNLNFIGELVTATEGSGSTDVTIDAKTLWLYAA